MTAASRKVRLSYQPGGPIELNYTVEGSGLPVVLIHGFTGNHRFFLRVTSALVGAGFRSISLDLRGHGASDKPADRRLYAIPLLAADVRGLTERLGIDKCVVLGHSMGAYVAQEIALQFSNSLSGLVIVDAGYGRRFATEREADERVAFLEQVSKADGMDGLFEATWGHLLYRNEAQRNSARRLFMETTIDAYMGCQYGMREWGSHLNQLRQITVPTLLIAAGNGTNIEAMKEMEARIPQSELVIIEGAGHNVFLDKPREFNRELVRFLNTLGDRPLLHRDDDR